MFCKKISLIPSISTVLKATALSLSSALFFSTASAENKNIVQNGGFEKGTLEHYSPQGTSKVSKVSIVKSPTKSGNFASQYRLEFDQATYEQWKDDEVKRKRLHRSEVTLKDGIGKFQFGKEYTISLDYRYENWVTDATSEIAPFQVHTKPSSWGKIDGVKCRLGSAHSTAPFLMHVQNGKAGFLTYGGKTLWREPIEKKKWLNVRVHFKLSSGSDGFIEAWYNGKKIGRVNGPNGPKYDNCGGLMESPYFKMGVYKSTWKYGATDSKVRELFIDNLKIVDGKSSPAQKDTQKPSTPENLKASSITKTSIKLNWNASSDNIGVNGYEVHYNDKVKMVSGNSTTLTGLTSNVNYSIRVLAKDAAGNKSAFSAPETAVTDAENSAPILAANAGRDKILRCGTIFRTVGNADNGKTATSDNATYRWTTSNGHIRKGANSKIAEVDKAGSYKLTVNKKGSTTVSDTAIITQAKGCVTIPVIYTLNYKAETGGKVTGKTNQKINHGKSGATVTAVAYHGYTFVKWSDGLKTAKRTDKVTGNLSVTAKFSKDVIIIEPPVVTKPKATTLIGPTGNTTDTTPTYSWKAVSGAEWYYLWSRDNKGDISNKWYHKSKLGCENGSGTCSTTPSTALPLGSVRWYVISWNKSGLSPWSKGMRFTVTDPTNPTAIVPDSPENLSEKAPTMPGAPEEATTDTSLETSDKASGGSFGFLILPLALMGLRRRIATLKTKV